MIRAISHRGRSSATFRSTWAALGERRSSAEPPIETGGFAIAHDSQFSPEHLADQYKLYAELLPNYLTGAFAFAIWDPRDRILFCARDRFGVKPFYYFWNGREFVFGSEIKVLLAHPSVTAELDESMLAEHLAWGYSNSDRTLFRGIQKLLPGHTLTLDSHGTLSVDRYWEPPLGPEAPADEETALRQCRELMEEAVLRSPQPAGVLLSGGVDSALVAAILARSGGHPVKTFSVGYAESEFDQLDYARSAAKSIGTEHREARIGFEGFLNAIPGLIWHKDEPLVWPSHVSYYFAAKLAADHVDLALSGEGVDELFAGYPRYPFCLRTERILPLWKFLPEQLRSSLRIRIGASKVLPTSLQGKLGRTFIGLGDDCEAYYLENFYAACRARDRAALGYPGPAHKNYLSLLDPQKNTLQRLVCADQKTYLAAILVRQDRMTMAAELESHAPFADHKLAEFAASLPGSLKTNGSINKYLVKKVAAEYLPADFAFRHKFGRFPTPMRAWMRDPRIMTVLGRMLDRSGFLASIVKMDVVHAMVSSHLAGECDATDRLWRLLNLHLWGEMHLEGRLNREDLLLQAGAAVV